MVRSSRHRSHRSHRHRDRSGSEEEGNYRKRKQRAEDEEPARVSRGLDREKRTLSSKDEAETCNGDLSGDRGKKRKDRVESSDVGDRWNGGGDDEVRVDKELRKDGSDVVDVEKGLKSKLSVVELKGKSSSGKKREASSERNEEKRRLEKETSWRESTISSQYKDGKVKEREREREGAEKQRGSEKEKKVQDSRHERAVIGLSRKEEHVMNQDVEISELEDEMPNSKLEKELEKCKKGRDGSHNHDKWVDDGKDGDTRQMSSKDNHSKMGSYKDGRYKEKYREELDRNQSRRDDKYKDEHSSRIRTSIRSENKGYRDVGRLSESRHKKTKLHDSDRDSNLCVDDNRGQKRTSDDIEDYSDVKSRSAKELREDTTANGSSSTKFDSRSDRDRVEHPHLDRVNSALSNSRSTSSPKSSAFALKDHNRHNSRQVDSTHTKEVRLSGTVFRDHASASGGPDRLSESRLSEKARLKDDVSSDRNSRPDAFFSNQLTEKSPSSTSKCRPERTTAPRNQDMEEVVQRASNSKGRSEREYLVENLNADNTSKPDIFRSELVLVGPCSSNQTTRLRGNSPDHLPPPPPVRVGVDSPLVLGSYEDDTRSQSGDRKNNTHCNKRNNDSSVGRGPGAPWKSAPTWPSAVANGFMPLQHGPPTGFHSAIQQFPGLPLFGVKPSIDLNHTSYQFQGVNRFRGHSRPYGWHNPVDDPPHLQVWNGSANVFGDESRIYSRQEGDQKRHLMNSSGWEMNDVWSVEKENVKMEFPVPQERHEYSRDEQARSEQPRANASGTMVPNDTSLRKHAVEALKYESKKQPEPSRMPSVKVTTDNDVRVCCSYLSKLDISLYLAHPDLYKKCMLLIETRDRFIAGNVSIKGQQKNNIHAMAKNKHYARNSVFPLATDAIFQRAISLYKKQTEGMKEIIHSSLPLVRSKEQNNLPDIITSDFGNVNGISVSADHMGEGNAVTSVEGEHSEDPGDAEEKQCDKPGDTQEQYSGNPGNNEEKQCDKISNAVVFIEGFENSDALNPERGFSGCKQKNGTKGKWGSGF